MAPVMPGATEENRLSRIFAEAIRYQLLPRDIFFQLRDFQVFAEMGIETKQLPADDVEACIREIKQAGPHLDPSKAEDREKMGLVIQRYFADPGTKHKRKIEELQTKSENLSQELAEEKRKRGDAERSVEELKTRAQEMSKQIENGQAALANAGSRIERLERSTQEQEKVTQHKLLVVSAAFRTGLAFAMLVVVEVAIGYLVWQYGEGPNLFQKLTKAWPWLGLGFAIVAVPYRFFMGRERMRLLKWWKGEID
jgi:phytoene dehydrogenase-like protein